MIGFIEGDGSFCFSLLQPRISIGLHINNLRVIQAIKEFIDNLPIMYKTSKDVQAPQLVELIFLNLNLNLILIK